MKFVTAVNYKNEACCGGILKGKMMAVARFKVTVTTAVLIIEKIY